MKTTELRKAPTDDCYGFYGTIKGNSETDENPYGTINADAAARLWDAAFEAMETPDYDAQATRNFLRAPAGRHLADEVYNQAYPETSEKALKAAIPSAVEKAKAWKSYREILRATMNGTYNENL